MLSLLCIACCFNAWTQKVSPALAAKVAISHMGNRGMLGAEIIQMEVLVYEGDTCLFRFFFDDKEWYLVSADLRAVPVVAFGDDYQTFNDIPEAMQDMIESYKRQISDVINERGDTRQAGVNPLWQALSENSKALPVEYQQSGILLDRTNRGKIVWGQHGNNDYTCTPSYNDACEYDEDCEGSCSHKPVGCGAVAMGMVMWYWQWPRTSSEIHCNWGLIPPELHENTPSDEVAELTHFLRDCGEKMDMTYWCAGSWSLIWNINSALHDLGYESSIYYRSSAWSLEAWNELLKSEIKNNRPIIYYGEPGLNVTKGHYFVIDGYDDEGKFHVNFGHKRSGNGWFFLSNIIYGGTSYADKQHAIVGISPKYNDTNIMQLPYDSISNRQWRVEYAFESIEIPAAGMNLVAQNGSEFFLEAGQEIVLKPGFEACNGSVVEAGINPVLQSQMEITVPFWPNGAYWGGSGYSLNVTNADSLEFVMKNIHNDPVFFSAGSIDNSSSTVSLWDGSGELYEYVYYGNVRFKNSYGRELRRNGFPIYLITRFGDSIQSDNDTASMDFLKPTINMEDDVFVFPNPSMGEYTVKTFGEEISTLEVYTMKGSLVFSDNKILQKEYEINLSGIVSDVYFLVVNGKYVKKIIKL